MKWLVLHKFIKELQHSHILERAESREHGAWSREQGAEDRIPFSSSADKSDKQ